MIRSGSQSDADAEIILQADRQLALYHWKNIVLLFLYRFGVVDVTDAAVELKPRRQLAHPTVVDAAGVAELEAQVFFRACYGLFKNWIEHYRNRSDIFLHGNTHFEFQCCVIELRGLLILDLKIP